ncbi:MAG TPA: ribokinase [Bacteroidales bacterium]|jgi:ribokinase|nr:ribokinase [Bacteroidales bacterium]HNR42500.1 ribokinase [Bacteroidales bacterium]HPM18633.1 ribokinase [Bacteroidales bacterium]
MNRIIVIGSSNTDMVIKAKKLPAPGETVLGGTFLMNPGGKGANQAVAAARLEGKVTFVTKTGNDLFGEQAIHLFKFEGIDTRFIIRDPKNPSGIALITVDENGENCIVVAQGSNATLAAYDIEDAAFEADSHDVFLMQLEIPVSTVEFVAQKVFNKGIRVILNPAPARLLPNELLECLYLITPNEIEAELLTGIKVTDAASARTAAGKLLHKGVRNVVITMGAAGAFLMNQDFAGMVPVVPVKAVDTTAAGDVFNGALAVAIAEGAELKDAVDFANRAAAISVTRMGAQSSAPYRKELQ